MKTSLNKNSYFGTGEERELQPIIFDLNKVKENIDQIKENTQPEPLTASSKDCPEIIRSLINECEQALSYIEKIYSQPEIGYKDRQSLIAKKVNEIQDKWKRFANVYDASLGYKFEDLDLWRNQCWEIPRLTFLTKYEGLQSWKDVEQRIVLGTQKLDKLVQLEWREDTVEENNTNVIKAYAQLKKILLSKFLPGSSELAEAKLTGIEAIYNTWQNQLKEYNNKLSFK